MDTVDLAPSDPKTNAYLHSSPEKTAQMSGNEARASLEAQRLQALDKMVDEPDRAKRKVLRQTVSALEIGIASLPSDQSQGEYGHFKRIADAIKACLQDIGRPASTEQIVDMLIEGGMRRKPLNVSHPTEEEILKHTRTRIRKSIAFHLVNPRGIEAEVIKEVNGTIGLWDWPDERFQ